MKNKWPAVACFSKLLMLSISGSDGVNRGHYTNTAQRYLEFQSLINTQVIVVKGKLVVFSVDFSVCTYYRLKTHRLSRLRP